LSISSVGITTAAKMGSPWRSPPQSSSHWADPLYNMPRATPSACAPTPCPLSPARCTESLAQSPAILKPARRRDSSTKKRMALRALHPSFVNACAASPSADGHQLESPKATAQPMRSSPMSLPSAAVEEKSTVSRRLYSEFTLESDCRNTQQPVVCPPAPILRPKIRMLNKLEEADLTGFCLPPSALPMLPQRSVLAMPKLLQVL
jgi:hypothetical protein